MTQNLKIKACLKQNVMELDMIEKIYKNPGSNFHKQAGPHFFKNHGMNPANKIIQSQKMSLPWGLGTRN